MALTVGHIPPLTQFGSAYAALLVTEGFDGVHAGGADCRVDAEDDADGDGDAERDRDRDGDDERVKVVR